MNLREKNKEDDVVFLIKMKKQLDEDPIVYAEKVIRIGLERQLKLATIITIINTNLWPTHHNSQIFISSATSTEELIQKISQIKLSLAISSQKKQRNKAPYCKTCKKYGHTSMQCLNKKSE